MFWWRKWNAQSKPPKLKNESSLGEKPLTECPQQDPNGTQKLTSLDSFTINSTMHLTLPTKPIVSSVLVVLGNTG